MARAKSSHPDRISSLVGQPQAEAYFSLHGAAAVFERRTNDRFFGGGGISFLDPKDVVEVGGAFRPGLVAFAEELAGDLVCWDLRRGRTKQSPSVVYVDHEQGLATPFAHDVEGALVHILANTLIGTPKEELGTKPSLWVEVFGPALGSRVKLVTNLAARVERMGAKPVFQNDEAALEALGELIPPGDSTWGVLPPTYVPLSSPDDPKGLDEAIERYEDSTSCYRELVEVEGRAPFAWHLAATLRGLSDTLLRRKKFGRAKAAAEEAITQYEPILEAGDDRVAGMLAFSHRVVAVVAAREKNWASAYEHADRALTLSESVLLHHDLALRGLGFVAEAWERELDGDSRSEVSRCLKLALDAVGPFAERSPPHALAEPASRVVRLAKRRSRR